MSLLGQYEYIIDKFHPRASSEGCVYVHVIVAEQKLGRFLLPEEVVHHKDLNKLNNDPENIMVFASIADHSRFHGNNCDESLLSINSNGAYVYPQKKYYCIDCGAETTRYAMRCKSCFEKQRIHDRKVERPSAEKLFNVLSELHGNFTKVGKMFNVSDNAVRKWCKIYDLPSKSSQYKPQKIKQEKEENKCLTTSIAQLDKETNKVINCFENIYFVMKYLGLNEKYKFHILDVCKGKPHRKTAYGYKWKFI